MNMRKPFGSQKEARSQRTISPSQGISIENTQDAHVVRFGTTSPGSFIVGICRFHFWQGATHQFECFSADGLVVVVFVIAFWIVTLFGVLFATIRKLT